MTKPVCFMVMPFGVKPVLPAIAGAPESIDFDALWNLALCPIIEELGYDAVRADQDIGAGIILEMLERLFFSDLVVADMTIPNGNVYYEVGIRHASRQRGCVLISADWAVPLFDLNQMRRVTYPMPAGEFSAESAATVIEALRSGAKTLAEGDSPMYQSIPGFPDPQKVDPIRASAFRAEMAALSQFQSRVRAAYSARGHTQRRELAVALCDEYPPSRTVSTNVALELLALKRDCIDWQSVLEYCEAMPTSFTGLEVVREQQSLARSKSGDHLVAIGALEELIKHSGKNSERYGIIGGRYKKLATSCKEAGDQLSYEDYLEASIDAYEQSMQLDLNNFYPASNLPFLYRERAGDGDEEQAKLVAKIAMMACERDLESTWARSALLTLAFFDEDVDRAKHCARQVRREGTAKWQLESTIDTLERSTRQTTQQDVQLQLQQIVEELKSLVDRA